jgi:hypothetical protein
MSIRCSSTLEPDLADGVVPLYDVRMEAAWLHDHNIGMCPGSYRKERCGGQITTTSKIVFVGIMHESVSMTSWSCVTSSPLGHFPEFICWLLLYITNTSIVVELWIYKNCGISIEVNALKSTTMHYNLFTCLCNLNFKHFWVKCLYNPTHEYRWT